MRLFLLASLAVAALAAPAAGKEAPLDPKTAVYEMRTYYPAAGKSEALNARFRNHTLKFFAKYGMTNVAYWNEVPTPAAPDGRLIYVLAYPSAAAREADWKALGNDAAWKNVLATTEANGKIVDRIESVFMKMADYSPNPLDRK